MPTLIPRHFSSSCAGDADDLHLPAGMAVEITGAQRQAQPAVLHQDVRDVHGRRLLTQHGRTSLLGRHGDKYVSVGGKAGDRHEKVSAVHRSGIAHHSGDLRLRIGVKLQDRQVLDRVNQSHFSSSLSCLRWGDVISVESIGFIVLVDKGDLRRVPRPERRAGLDALKRHPDRIGVRKNGAL